MGTFKYYHIENLPAYWDITTWTIVKAPYLIMCFRDSITRRRVLKVINIIDDTIYFESNTYFNFIIGSINDSNILISRIDDARSHDQLSKISSFNIEKKEIIWQVKENIIVEKYSTPRTMNKDLAEYPLGKKIINLQSGEVTENSTHLGFSGNWTLGNITLRQDNRILYALDAEGNILWSKENYHGKWLQGSIKGKLFFLLPQKQLVVLNETEGEEIKRVDLTNIREENAQTNGDFDYFNDTSYRNSFIADQLVSEQYILWLTKTNDLAISDYTNTNYYNIAADENTFLCAITKKYVLAIKVNDQTQSGDLIIINLEDLINE